MPYYPCIPNETVVTVAQYKAAVAEMLLGEFGSGVREIQFGNKRAVFRSMTELQGMIQAMRTEIWGHCYQRGVAKSSTQAISSKGL